MSVFVVAVLIQQPHSLGTIVFLNHRKSRSTSVWNSWDAAMHQTSTY